MFKWEVYFSHVIFLFCSPWALLIIANIWTNNRQHLIFDWINHTFYSFPRSIQYPSIWNYLEVGNTNLLHLFMLWSFHLNWNIWKIHRFWVSDRFWALSKIRYCTVQCVSCKKEFYNCPYLKNLAPSTYPTFIYPFLPSLSVPVMMAISIAYHCSSSAKSYALSFLLSLCMEDIPWINLQSYHSILQIMSEIHIKTIVNCLWMRTRQVT